MKHPIRRLLSLILIILVLFLSVSATDREAARKRMEALSAEISRHDHLYYDLGKPEISDTAYDRLFDELVGLEKAFPDFVLPDSPTKRVGSQMDNSFPHVRHPVPMLSLRKYDSPEQIVAWVRKIRNQAGQETTFVVEEKIDGTAIELVYDKGILVTAATRGDGKKGYDVTNNARTIRSVPLRLKKPVSLTVRGEVFIGISDFRKLRENEDAPYHEIRNSAAGALRKKHSSETAKIPLDMIAFEAVSGDIGDFEKHSELLVFMAELGFKINSANQTFAEPEKLAGHMESVRSRRDTLDYEIDGIVVKVNERAVRKALGTDERFPRWAAAYKFESSEQETILENIGISIGRSGRVTPVAEFRPVSFGRTRVSRATLHNQDYIDALELALGDRVKIARKGGTIPALVSVAEKNMLGNGTWQMPRDCPACGNALKAEGRHHFCVNTDCPERVRESLAWFSKKMGIKYLGPKTLAKLVSRKRIRHPEDIYTLGEKELAELDGFGDKKTKAFMDSLEQSKNKPCAVVLSALGIEGLGPRNIRILADAGFDSFDKILNAGQDGLAEVKGIGENTARKIAEGLGSRMADTVRSLKAHGLNL